MTTKLNIKTLVTITIFLMATLWFFFPIGKPDGKCLLFAMRLALPAVILTLGGIGQLPKLMNIGFCCCAIGDTMGVMGSFEGQMGGFAIAHLCFIAWFTSLIRQAKPHTAVLVATTFICALPLGLAALKVIPAIQDSVIRYGCMIYALLLTGTVWTSLVCALSTQKQQTTRPSIAAAGGLLFLVSDFILSWNKFTAPFPHASLYIMSTYYAALLFLFIGTSRTGRKLHSAAGASS